MDKKLLKELLKMHDMTQKYLAEKTGLSVAAISRYMCGNRCPNGVNLIKIAKVLDVPPEFLLERRETW